MKKVFVAFVCFCLINFSVFSQLTTYSAGMEVPEDDIRSGEEGFAFEEFRRGVQAYYKGAYNESIVLFEKALSYLPNDNLILEWLGKAYYQSGMEGIALSYWNIASENGYGGLLLENKIEIIRERRVTGDSKEKLMRLSETGSFPGQFEDKLFFSGPISALPNNDGTIWVTAYNSNQILKININGLIIDRITGPLNGFDRPLDIVRMSDGNMLVSESAGDRLALLDKKGNFIKYIGSKGRSLGQMIGPQYIALDSMDRIYVTDMGNRRVDVFDKEGNGLFFFGNKTSSFDGLKYPTGIAIHRDSVYVADEFGGTIYEFDLSGNYIQQLVEKDTFKKPEALKIWQDNIIICDENKILSVDLDSGSCFEYARTGNAPSRVTAAVADVNNNIIVTDYKANEIYVMSRIQELVGGLLVQIDKVDASAFPEVMVEVKVENRNRKPIVGLLEKNFYVTENQRPVSNLKLIGSASNNTNCDITFIIDNSLSAYKYKNEIETAVKEISASLADNGSVRLISASSIPVIEYSGNTYGLKDFSLETLKNPPSANTSIDLAIRLAANDLIKAEKKRSIIVLSDGNSSLSSFSKYNLSELTAYLNNNNIALSFVQLSLDSISDEYNYLIENTVGDLYYVYRPEGLKNIVYNICENPISLYQLTYTSSLQTGFGEKYLPIEIEAYLLNRSGRDESGYFAPLE